jgi:hypothetical protein
MSPVNAALDEGFCQKVEEARPLVGSELVDLVQDGGRPRLPVGRARPFAGMAGNEAASFVAIRPRRFGCGIILVCHS